MQDKIEIGCGYRRLRQDEIIRASDEYRCDNPACSTCKHTWHNTGEVGVTVADAGRGLIYRRKVAEVSPGAGYRLLADDEKIEPGDQFCWPEGGQFLWDNSEDIGSTPGSKMMKLVYRRKLPQGRPSEPGDGYRFIEKGEVIVKGDEFWSDISGKWKPSSFHGVKAKGLALRRRKLEMVTPEPGAGYRLLTIGEKIEPGDELLERQGFWTQRRTSIGKIVKSYYHPTRRKITPPVPKIYRLLSVGETIKDGDEVYQTCRWQLAQLGTVGKFDAPIRREMRPA